MRYLLNITVIILVLAVAAAGEEIKIQRLAMQPASDNPVFSEPLLTGEIAETEVTHFMLIGPRSEAVDAIKTHDAIFIFFKGVGSLRAGEQSFEIRPESIALPFKKMIVEVDGGDTLHYLRIRKKLSRQDISDIKSFPEGNRSAVYFTHFDDCEAYTEKIKSPNTVSRTVLPKDYAPRVAMGTVQTIGPDAVGAHRHPMLDQLFFGLRGNDVTVRADDKSIHFPEYSILHIPIGSNHGVTVESGKLLYYQWMDFFLTSKGQEWLKTHKKIDQSGDEKE